MTKKKLHETVLELCTEFKASAKLTQALSDLTIPKVGGGDVNDYTVFNEDGTVAFIYCNTHKQWEPVTAIGVDEDGEDVEFDLFKSDEKAKNGYWRDCNEGIAATKAKSKIFNVSKAAVMQDVLDEVITGTEGKASIADLELAKAVIEAREDGLGTEDKPELA